MTEIDLATAIKDIIVDWTLMTTLAQRRSDISNPATLGAILGLTVQKSLALDDSALDAFRRYLRQSPFVHLKQVFDTSSLVDTPTRFFLVPDTAGTIAGRATALAIHGFLQLETVSYGTENDGNLFVNLVALPGSGAFAEKSRRGMRGHTDGVSFPFNGEDDPQNPRIAPSPDLVTLVGLRNFEKVPTKVMPVRDLLPHLSPADVDELKKPQYSIRSQKTFVQGMKRILGNEHVLIDVPVLKDFAGDTYIRYSHSNVVPSTNEGPAQQASDNLEAACKKVAHSIVIQPGDVLIINNRLSLHGRGEAGNEIGGQSRWLLRTYALDAAGLPIHKRHVNGSPPHILYP